MARLMGGTSFFLNVSRGSSPQDGDIVCIFARFTRGDG